MHISTIDGLIAKLRALKLSLPGDTPVLIPSQTMETVVACTAVQRKIGKTDRNKLVTRGGVPCVLIVRSR